MVAFNKSIATELASRAPKGVDVKTLHGYGLSSITKKWGKCDINAQRVDNLIRARVGNDDETFDLRKSLSKIISLAKGCLAHTKEDVDSLIDAFGVETGETESDREAFIADVLVVLEWCKNPYTQAEATRNWNAKWNVFQSTKPMISFGDMIFLPVVHDLKVWQYDRVFIDETQDLNQAQIKLALKACKKGGRICAVGDKFQAIYSFRGADSAAIDNVTRELGAKVLPLSVTYRCAKSIVAIAKEFVPDLEAAPEAKEGTVSYIDEKQMLKEVKAGDFILSRSNAPLIGYCLRLIREGKRANIQGRDIGATLASFVKKSKCKTIPALITYTEAWRAKEIARLLKKIPPADTQSVDDKADTILALAEGVKGIDSLLKSIEDLFSDDDNANKIVLSTTHKAKGLERDRVFALRDTYMRSRRDQAVAQEEINLWYVCTTRAREHLFIVSKGRP